MVHDFGCLVLGIAIGIVIAWLYFLVWKVRYSSAIREDAVQRSLAVTAGKVHEQLVPYLPEFGEIGDRKSTRLNSQSPDHLVCRLLLEKKNKQNSSRVRSNTQDVAGACHEISSRSTSSRPRSGWVHLRRVDVFWSPSSSTTAPTIMVS